MHYVNYVSFRQLQHTWTNQEKDLANLSEEDIKQLKDYTQRANTTAGSAIALLRLNGIDTYKEPVYFPDATTQLRVAQYPEEEVINENDELFIYPNPANTYISIRYTTTESDDTDLSIIITDILGKEVHQEKLSYSQDEIVISTNRLPQGQYFCMLKSGNEIIKTDKFIVTK